MPFDYPAYLDCFLTGDDDALVERFFAEDCEMRAASGIRRGKHGMREFLVWAHEGVYSKNFHHMNMTSVHSFGLKAK